jgi:hypothetical protein
VPPSFAASARSSSKALTPDRDAFLGDALAQSEFLTKPAPSVGDEPAFGSLGGKNHMFARSSARWLSTVVISCLLGSLALACATEEFEPNDTRSSGAGGSAGEDGVGGAASGSGGATSKPGNPAGSACSDASSCASGFCVDGVCCASACDGTCESCAVAGSEGSCKPHAAGTDPDADCAGAGKIGDLCAGSCNGKGACEFPAGETPCGTTTCEGSKLKGDVCGGDGSCGPSAADCAPFLCSTGKCTTSCVADANCAADSFCNAGICAPKHPNGEACTASNECSSGLCEGGHCCGSACAAPNSCETGTCLCNGVACDPGATCESWYADQDGDGFAASSALDTLACSNQPPTTNGKKFTLAKDVTKPDCYDNNPSAFPGQTAYFTVHRGDGSFDYDCSGSDEKRYGNKSSKLIQLCMDCGKKDWLGMCTKCEGWTGRAGHVGFSCDSCGVVNTTSLFTSSVACGATGTLATCTATTTTCGTLTEVTKSEVQSCR